MSEMTAAVRYSEREIEEMDTQDLLRLYKETGDESLKWPLVLRYEGLIKSAAMQIRGVYSSFAQIDDIINEGIITLLGAIDKFDPDKGVKFETYVSKRIRGMVIDLARKQDWIPRNIRKRAKEIDAASAELATALGRTPTDGEIARHLGITQERYQKDAANIALSNVLSLDVLMNLVLRTEPAPEGDRPGDGAQRAPHLPDSHPGHPEAADLHGSLSGRLTGAERQEEEGITRV